MRYKSNIHNLTGFFTITFKMRCDRRFLLGQHGPLRCRWIHLLFQPVQPFWACASKTWLSLSDFQQEKTFQNCISVMSVRDHESVPCSEILLGLLWVLKFYLECLGSSRYENPPLNLPDLGLDLHLPYLQLEPRHYPTFKFFFYGNQLTGFYIFLPLWGTHTHVVPVSVGMSIHLVAVF